VQVAALPLQVSPSLQNQLRGTEQPVVDPRVQFVEFRVGPV